MAEMIPEEMSLRMERMSDRWTALREYLKQREVEVWECSNHAHRDGAKRVAYRWECLGLGISEAIAAMDDFGKMTDEEVKEWRQGLSR